MDIEREDRNEFQALVIKISKYQNIETLKHRKKKRK
jgi:hypothetical protein